MALNANALTSLAALKLRLGIDNTDTSNDDELTNYINEVSELVQSNLRRNLKAQDYTNELYQGNDEQDLLLDNYPINSIAQIEYRYYHPGAFYVIEPDEYFIHRKKYSVVREYGWYRFGSATRYLTKVEFPFYNIRITYNAGYTTIPSDIEGLVKDIIADMYTRVRTGGQGLKQYRIADIAMTWKDGLSDLQKSILGRYRKRRF